MSTPQYTLIDTLPALAAMLGNISDLPNSPPPLYLDLEGENLGREGTIAIIQIHVLPQNCTYLLDITTLGRRAFTFHGSDQTKNLKTILESSSTTKCLFDVRNDADALFNLYDISLQGVQDIQVMNYAAREARRGVFRRGNLIMGLAKCIATDSGLSYAALAEFSRKKQEGGRIFNPKLGGSYAVFSERPLREDVMEYCVGDVIHLPTLWREYSDILEGQGRLRNKVQSATLARLEAAKKPRVPDGKWRVNGPW
ncbi:ribonuclease H-like domain-containing protein [Tuber borchii]|uniref:Ribonuclease H-like domain-containing protein n=1 Tax=Tuber borchii TaxID=42251 RepID=A0A2T7A8Z9_TUBBO|nr:ribonuclease H-like domain-containing protein [Tuber borchii]